VTATQLDDDSSEYIDRIEFAALPTGYTLVTDGDLSTTGLPGDNSWTEYVQLWVPTGQDINYDLKVTAYAQEEATLASHEAESSAVQNIDVGFNQNQIQKTFQAVDQSIWTTGDAFSIDKEFFFGVNEPFDIDLVADGYFKAGFVADLHIEGGDIDASLPMDIEIDTTYNKTTNSLLIETNALLAAGGSFTTAGPEGNFALGFLIDVLIDAGILGTFDESSTSSALGLVPPISSTDTRFFDNFDWGTIGLEWPHLSVTNETQANNTITGDGASNDFIELTADLDALALQFFPTGPIGDLLRLIGPDHEDPEGSFQILDVDITASANLLQQFVLDVLDVEGTLTFEDGSTQSFTLGDDIVIRDASNLDVDGLNGIEFDLSLNPNVTLDNNLSIQFDMRGDLWLLKNDDLGLETHIPLFTAPLGDVSIVDGTPFSVAFNGQTWDNLVV
jgi:hypothetical protein